MDDAIDEVLDQLSKVVLGKREQLTLALCCLLSRGHLLIEDIPGVGKTTLALALARVFGLQFSRIQFTSDLLPADILGAAVFEAERNRFTFHPGPIFAQLVLADEVNRASPKTQSALLEAMEERQVTAEGETRPLPEPFFVIATQNPARQIGTSPLPESQLDRFRMRIRLGYPPPEAELELLAGSDRREMLAGMQPVLDPPALLELQARVRRVHVSEPLLRYVLALLRCSREQPGLVQGLSPRAGLALRAAAQAHALIHGRSGVIPEDVQAVFEPVVGHRLIQDAQTETGAIGAREILDAVPVP